MARTPPNLGCMLIFYNNFLIELHLKKGASKDTEYKIRNLKFKLSSRKKMQGNEKNTGF